MACEKCWSDAYLRHMSDPTKTQAEHYGDLLNERWDNPCTPEQERGGERADTVSARESGKLPFSDYTLKKLAHGFLVDNIGITASEHELYLLLRAVRDQKLEIYEGTD